MHPENDSTCEALKVTSLNHKLSKSVIFIVPAREVPVMILLTESSFSCMLASISLCQIAQYGKKSCKVIQAKVTWQVPLLVRLAQHLSKCQYHKYSIGGFLSLRMMNCLIGTSVFYLMAKRYALQ